MRIAGNVFALIEAVVAVRRPYRAIPQPGINLLEGPPGRHFIPDVALTCEPIAPSLVCEAPRLVVEVLSPLTQSYDKRFKLPVYAGHPSLDEIWLIDSRARCVQVWERRREGWHNGLPLIGEASFMSRVLGVEVTLDAIYALTSLEISAEEVAEEGGTGDTDGDDREDR
jgi:Uma2 family endonuclease